MFLVQENMSQKINQSTHKLQIQENLCVFFESRPFKVVNNPSKKSEQEKNGLALSNQGEFLYEMLEQVLKNVESILL
jgi:hypothetical protein